MLRHYIEFNAGNQQCLPSRLLAGSTTWVKLARGGFQTFLIVVWSKRSCSLSGSLLLNSPVTNLYALARNLCTPSTPLVFHACNARGLSSRLHQSLIHFSPGHKYSSRWRTNRLSSSHSNDSQWNCTAIGLKGKLSAEIAGIWHKMAGQCPLTKCLTFLALT